jgi:hypothetical protein
MAATLSDRFKYTPKDYKQLLKGRNAHRLRRHVPKRP